MSGWFAKNLAPDWVESVDALSRLLKEGDAVYQMMQVTGEEGVTVEDFVKWQKATLVDMVFLQQDAFDEIDASTPRERQLESFQLLKELVSRDYHFGSTDEVREFFTRLTGLYKNVNYSPMGSPEYGRYVGEIQELARSRSGFRPEAVRESEPA
jgi:V/A-type H+-transporting ATPase subunit A